MGTLDERKWSLTHVHSFVDYRSLLDGCFRAADNPLGARHGRQTSKNAS